MQAAVLEQKLKTQTDKKPPTQNLRDTRRPGLVRIADRCKWKCYWCQQGMRPRMGFQNSATIEHMIPRSQGGSNEHWNLTAACARCNTTRGVMSADEFADQARNFSRDNRLVSEAVNARKKARNRLRTAARRAAQQGIAPTVDVRSPTLFEKIAAQIKRMMNWWTAPVAQSALNVESVVKIDRSNSKITQAQLDELNEYGIHGSLKSRKGVQEQLTKLEVRKAIATGESDPFEPASKKYLLFARYTVSTNI